MIFPHPVKIRHNQLRRVRISNSHLRHPERVGEPHCTHSEIFRYYDHGLWVAVMHRYRRRNGRIGGSGKLDPKRLRLGNTIYIIDSENP